MYVHILHLVGRRIYLTEVFCATSFLADIPESLVSHDMALVTSVSVTDS